MKLKIFLNSALGSLVFLTACSSSKQPDEPLANEIPTTPTAQIDLPQAELFANAKRLYSSSLYTVSRESFQSLRDGFSPGPYTEYAEIKIADSHFEMREFEIAGNLYEEFIKNHPASKANPYAMLRGGRSFEFANKGIGRDAAPLEKAKDLYEKLLTQYPDSVYAGAARKFHAGLIQKLADYELMISTFYEKKQNENAVIARNEYYHNNWVPLVKKAQETEAPGDEVVVDMGEMELTETAPPRVVEISRNSQVAVKRKVPAPLRPDGYARAKNDTNLVNATYHVQSIQCDRASKTVIFYLNNDFADEQFVLSQNNINPQGGSLNIHLPETSSKANTIDCFTRDDLKISDNGEIKLVTSSTGSLITVSNPPRLLLAVD